MAKTSRPGRKMEVYFRNLEKNSFCLNYNKKGSAFTKTKKWDVFRKLTKKILADEEPNNKTTKETRNSDPCVQLLPRRDVLLYGTIPAMEQRVYSKCKNCSRVFNPKDVLSHQTCSKTHNPYSSLLLKKKVKSKNGGSNNSKKSNSNGNPSSNSISSNSSSSTQEFELKRPYTPPPKKALGSASKETPTPQLKVSVTKIGVSKSSKSTPVSVSPSTPTLTTSSEKSDSKVASSKATSSVHHSRRSPGHHGSKSSSGHSLRSPATSSSAHHGSKNSSSSHHSPKNQSSSSSSSHHRSKSPSGLHHNTKTASKSSSSHHGNSHHGSSSSHHSSRSSSSKPTPMDTLSPNSSSHHHHSANSSSHSSSSSRHKKSSSSSSKRSSSGSSGSGTSSISSSSKILPKSFDPDIHCGVVEGSKGPCMRSITCSNHRLHLRKQVSGRSKDIHQLIAERKAAKENDLKHTTPPCSYTSPNGEAKEILTQNTSYVPVVAQVASTTINSVVTNSFVPIVSRVSSHQTRLSTASVLEKKPMATENVSVKAMTNGYISRTKNLENTQDNASGTVPVVIMPISPVSVVSSVQLLKIGNNIISLVSPQSAASPPSKKHVILPIQNYNNGMRMYKSHPKPVTLPNFGTRKLGGAILLANPLLEDQRNDLLTTIDFKLETANTERGLSGLNHTNSPHRPNILKGKGGLKPNCKRPATDKLSTSDSKRLIPDVNGFILHADVSETADAPQYSGENGPSQHELIISLIDKYGF